MTPRAWSVQGSPAAFLSLPERVGEADTARAGACGKAGASDWRRDEDGNLAGVLKLPVG